MASGIRALGRNGDRLLDVRTLSCDTGFWPIQKKVETAVVFCFIYLFLMTTGAGKWSIDGLLSRRKENK